MQKSQQQQKFTIYEIYNHVLAVRQNICIHRNATTTPDCVQKTSLQSPPERVYWEATVAWGRWQTLIRSVDRKRNSAVTVRLMFAFLTARSMQAVTMTTLYINRYTNILHARRYDTALSSVIIRKSREAILLTAFVFIVQTHSHNARDRFHAVVLITMA